MGNAVHDGAEDDRRDQHPDRFDEGIPQRLHLGARLGANDPKRDAGRHGGKDRHPYPVPIKVYDETIRVLKGAIQNAKLGREEEMQAIKRLDEQARRLERTARGPSVEAYIAGERAASPHLDGRSVFGWERDLAATKNRTG